MRQAQAEEEADQPRPEELVDVEKRADHARQQTPEAGDQAPALEPRERRHVGRSLRVYPCDQCFSGRALAAAGGLRNLGRDRRRARRAAAACWLSCSARM